MTFFNCHTHIFTINHVPKYIGKKMLPSIFSFVFNIGVINYFYTKLNSRKEGFIQDFKYSILPRLKRKWGYFIDFLKITLILYWIFLLLRGAFKIIFKISRLTLKLIVSPFFGKRSKEGLKRYLGIARHATYSSQRKIFEVLRRAYPDNFSFVVLAMDMEFMNAGDSKEDYYTQLSQLIKLKKDFPSKLHTFVATDPRRLEYSKNPKINFEKFIKVHFLNLNFSGIKLYPALGYYPFDKRFKSIYEFCVENEIPIMSHCIEGTIYYRGSKTREEKVDFEGRMVSLNNKKEWKQHPILKINKETTPLDLPQKQNHDFSKNFGHPLNYKCLLDKKKASEYFGEKVDFSKLKICLAHFGGTDEWEKYFEDIYETYNNNLFKEENLGKATAYSNVKKIWNSASWLSIIYDLMVEYDNVYADMSFMIYNEKNFNLLKLLIDDEKVGHRILFGTDFYVVAQKGTEKRLYHTIKAALGSKRFEKVAVTNAKTYLSSKLQTF